MTPGSKPLWPASTAGAPGGLIKRKKGANGDPGGQKKMLVKRIRNTWRLPDAPQRRNQTSLPGNGSAREQQQAAAAARTGGRAAPQHFTGGRDGRTLGASERPTKRLQQAGQV